MDDLLKKAGRRADPRVIAVRGAREHNLKNVDLDIPRDQLVVFTGLSGSGKSSLAFDTIYAEGQRRYVESLSAYARQFLEMMQKPDVEHIEGLSPAISIEQKTTSRNPRSTVGTVTEIYDYLRLLYARVGIPYSPVTGLPIESQTVSQMVDKVLALPEGTRLYLLAPIARGRKGEYRRELNELMRKGFQRVKLDGEAGDRRVGDAYPGEQQPQIVVDFGDRADRGARVPAGRLLLDRNRGAEPVDLLDIGLLHHLEELARIGREALDITALAFGIDGVEGERGFPRTGEAGHHDQLVTRQPQVDRLEVVLLGATDDEIAVRVGYVGHRSSISWLAEHKAAMCQFVSGFQKKELSEPLTWACDAGHAT